MAIKRTAIALIAALIALTLGMLLFPWRAEAQPACPVRNGCTGTSTLPGYGEVLVGNGSGIYAPRATSSLGIQTGGPTSTNPIMGSYVNATGSATSTFSALSVSIAFNLLGEYVTNLTTWVRGKIDAYLSGGQGITYSSGAISFDCSEVEGTGIDCSGENITLDATGAWTGTFDGLEGASYLANSFSTTSADVWKGLRDFFSTTSASYFLSQNQGAAFSTTSANAWQTTRNFFSTTSADAWDATKSRWATTSADYWLTLNRGNAFSTTSADNWKTANNFFSTTSADAWDATKSRWATTSADFWLTQNRGNAFSTTSTNFWETQQTARTADNLGDNNIDDLLDVNTSGQSAGNVFGYDGSVWKPMSTSSYLTSSELDTVGELETQVGAVNIILNTEIDTSGELAAILTDETGSGGGFVRATGPTLAGFISTASSTIGDGTRAGGLTINGGATTTATATLTGANILSALTFGGVTGSIWPDFCVAITGSSGLCDGSDDGVGGSGFSTTSADFWGSQKPYATTTTVCATGCKYTSINSAISALPASGGVIQLQNETYAGPVSITKSNVTIQGQGYGATLITCDGAVDGLCVSIATSSQLTRIQLWDFGIDNTNASHVGTGLDTSDTSHVKAGRIRITDFDIGHLVQDTVNQTFYHSYEDMIYFDTDTCMLVKGTLANQHESRHPTCRIGKAAGMGYRFIDAEGWAPYFPRQRTRHRRMGYGSLHRRQLDWHHSREPLV